MATTTPKKAVPLGPLEALKDLDEQAARVQSHRQKLEAETAAISGAFNTHDRRVGGKIAELKTKISDARAAALRDGTDADTAAHELEIAKHEQRLEWIASDRRAARQALDAITNERRAVLVGRHGEFVALARAESDAGLQLLATASGVCRDVLEHRERVAQLLRLMTAGHPGNQPGKLAADENDRRNLWRSFEPFAETRTPENNALWESVARLSTVPTGG